MPIAKQIDPGFSTADADHPTISYAEGTLQLGFVDWRDQSVLVTFRDVCRFEWSDEADDFFEGEPDDGTCIVKKSGWVPTVDSKDYEHYRLNFNGCGGRLNIACRSFDVDHD